MRPALTRSLALLLLLCVAGCGRGRDEPAEAATEFLYLIGQGKTREAYDGAAFAFQARRSFASFDALVRDLGFLRFRSVAWSEQTSEKNETILGGLITTEGEEKIPVTLSVILEKGLWRVFDLKSAPPDAAQPVRFSLVGREVAFHERVSKPLPAKERVRELVKRTLLDFNQALVSDSFTDFYETISLAWQSQATQRQLTRAFQSFAEASLDFSALSDVEPAFDEPPRIDSQGLLLAIGHWPGEPSLLFELKYIYEFPEWKLFGMQLALKP